MTHYVIAHEPFDRSCRDLLATGWRLQWEEPKSPPTRRARTSTRRKFSCPECGLAAYSKPSAWLICGGCLTVLR